MIYFIVTASLFNDCNVRKDQYVKCINKLKEMINIENSNIIICENNGNRDTILNTLGVDVYYTNNNFSDHTNKGYKELRDVLDCIEFYNINDTDFIVKMTGRYMLDDNSEFMQTIHNLNDTNYDCVIRYGSFMSPCNYKTIDCITGLIGMRCCFVKQINLPTDSECVEWNWAKAAYLIDDAKIYKVTKLGINVCPNHTNFNV